MQPQRLMFLLVLALQGCAAYPLSSTNKTYEPAMINNISAPKSITLGMTAIITASVYAGPKGSYSVGHIEATTSGDKRVYILAYSRYLGDNKAVPEEPVVGLARAEFTPTSTGTYLVEANRFISDYYPGSPSATAEIIVTAS